MFFSNIFFEHQIHEPASAEALRKIFNASEIDEEDIREGVSLLAEEIELLVHGQTNILKKINEVGFSSDLKNLVLTFCCSCKLEHHTCRIC